MHFLNISINTTQTANQIIKHTIHFLNVQNKRFIIKVLPCEMDII